MYLMATRAYAKIIALVAIKYLYNIERCNDNGPQGPLFIYKLRASLRDCVTFVAEVRSGAREVVATRHTAGN